MLFIVTVLSIAGIVITPFILKKIRRKPRWAPPVVIKKKGALIDRIRSLTNLVKTQHSNIFKVIFVSIGMVIKSTFHNMGLIPPPSERVGKNSYEITYMIQNITYKMVINVRKGPREIIKVIDCSEKDVTHHIIPYAGPKEDFHGVEITPEFFEKEYLIVEYSDGTEKLYNKYQPLKSLSEK